MYKFHLYRTVFCISASLYGSSHFIIPQPKEHFPSTKRELIDLVHQAITEQRSIAIVGTNKSQGGQTVCKDNNAYRINIKHLNKVVSFDVEQKQITVQAGMTWRELQNYIKPFGLSVRAMQSYADFSIGGSISVNVHGQDIENNPLIKSIIACSLITSKGEIVTISRDINPELFQLVVGGYGLFGLIVDVTLSLTDNVRLKRSLHVIDTKELASFFQNNIQSSQDIQFYSARFSLGSNDFLKKALVITYTTESNSPVEEQPRSRTKSTVQESIVRKIVELTRYTLFRNMRFGIEKAYLQTPAVLTRNEFMSHSLDELPYDSQREQYILQEYFIPYHNLNTFMTYVQSLTPHYDIELLNITARHVNADQESILSYAPTDRCALVFYIHVDKKESVYENIIEYTHLLIKHALQLDGSYYLPYQIIGEPEQFKKAYPRWNLWLEKKLLYDPTCIFTNRLYETYASLAK